VGLGLGAVAHGGMLHGGSGKVEIASSKSRLICAGHPLFVEPGSCVQGSGFCEFVLSLW
jgi:hypothetical protein